MSENDWKKRLNVVYSTDPDYRYEHQEEQQAETLPPAKQNLRIALDKRNRGGKQVTLVSDFRGGADDLKELCRILKNKCGVGGSAKDGEIIIQGDLRQKIAELLRGMGYRARVI